MHRALCLILVLLNITTSSCFFSAGLTRLTRRSCAMTGRRGAALCGLRAQADGEEWALSNEQCDLLQLPRGTKMVGEMSESMTQRLSTMGTYEDSNPIRYFGNEKFRKENYFVQQKLVVNAKRMGAKVRKAEIEERMDSGMSYEQAQKEVDAIIKAADQNVDGGSVSPPEGAMMGESVLRELFAICDTDASGTISTEEMTKAFSRLRAKNADLDQVRADVNTVLDSMDIDRSGAIDFQEFMAVANLFVQTASRQVPKQAPKQEANAGGGGFFGGLFGGGAKPAAAETAAPAAGAPSEWQELVDQESGASYYYNEGTGVTTWDKPV